MSTSSSLPSPSRNGSLKPSQQLTGYLAGAAGFTAALAAPQADAAVTAVTFGFGPTYTESDGSSNRWTVGSFGGVTGVAYLNEFAGEMFLGSYYSPVYNNGTGLPTFFANGTVIGNGLNGARGRASWRSEGSYADPSADFTSDQLNKNIGFKTSFNNWGWANVSWTESTKTLAINSAYVESIAGNPITVGDTGISAAPEPSRALLALAGLGGVALRRRRKLAA